ncbi:MAG: 4Fe-4S ferredoxin iron-sulfur binding protein [Clostridia bacterium]|nr:4Fe-4S ferredoxin iron-sulfur binding protein [Clostridia bacterium]
MLQVKEFIEDSIKQMVFSSDNIMYRQPIIAFADAEDPEFDQIKNVTHDNHMLPREWMPGGKTIVSYFIPFTKELVKVNREHEYVAKEWAVAYIETNDLIKQINNALAERLKQFHIDTVWQLPDINFDGEKLMAYWSQRHIAYIAGIGTFGINNMLITDMGCAGRYGSFIIDYKIEPSKKNREEKCLYKRNGSCGICMDMCPVQALTSQGYDRFKCNQRVWEVDEFYNDLAPCDCCGKCLLGPCAIWDKSF